MSTRAQVESVLLARGFKTENGNRLRGSSPLRPGSDSNAFVVTFHDDEHGAYSDHAANDSGSLYELAEKLGIETPRGEVENTKRGYQDAQDYAKAHGVEWSVYAAAGWQEVTHQNRPALKIPTQNGPRYRFIDGDKPPFINEPGYKTCWYGLQRAVQIAKDKGLPIVICNGEPSVVAAQHYGIPACSRTNGESKLPDNLLVELRKTWSGDVLLAFDCDETGRKTAREVVKQIENAEIIDLKLGDKGDLADFCRLHGETSMQALLDLVPQTSNDFTSAAQLADVEFAAMISAMNNPGSIRGLKSGLPSFDNALGGFMDGRSYGFYGDTGMGKSTLMCSIIPHLAAQVPVAVDTTEITAGAYLTKIMCAVARVPFDKVVRGTVNKQEYKRMEDAYETVKKLPIHFFKTSPKVSDIQDKLALMKRRAGIGAFVWDSISKAKSDSSAIYDRTVEAANAFQDIAKELNIPVLFTSQVGRNLKDRSNKVPTLHDGQGGGMIEQNADLVLAVYRHHHYVMLGEATPRDDYSETTASLHVLKDRWMGTTGRAFKLEFVGGAAYYEQDTRRIDLKAI